MEWVRASPAQVAERILATLFPEAVAVAPAASPAGSGRFEETAVPADSLSTLREGRPTAGRTFPLATFQEAAVARARLILQRRGGAILADAVGLGKTYVALALIEEAIRAGEDVAVIVPASLRRSWSPLLGRVARRARRTYGRCGEASARSSEVAQQPCAGGAITLLSHTQLSVGTHGPERLSAVGLLVIDEAHAFRTRTTRRYRSLAALAPAARVLLITATPVNNALADLHHLLSLFAADDAFRDIGIPSLSELFREAERNSATDAGALEPAPADRSGGTRGGTGGGASAGGGSHGEGGVGGAALAAVRRVVAEVVIRRTRVLLDRDVEAGWAELRFPRRATPRLIRYHVPALTTAARLIGELELPMLGPARAVKAGVEAGARPSVGPAAGHTDGAGALVRIGLLKRLESGSGALRRSARRQLALAEAFAGAARRGLLLRPTDTTVLQGAGEAVAQLVLEALVAEAADPGVDPTELAESAERDVARLRRLLREVREPDPKLAALRASLDRLPRRDRVLLFTEFRDTAESLWRALAPLGGVARIDGGGAWLGKHRAGRGSVIRRFAPHANGRREPPEREAVRLLIATDVLAEGLNLQDARHVIAYDLPWNPVRLLQRIGRADRLGSPHDEVIPHLVVPTAGLDELLRLVRRLRSKLDRISGAVGDEAADQLLEALMRAGARTGPTGYAQIRRIVELSADAVDPLERLRALGGRASDAGPIPRLGGRAVTAVIEAVAPDTELEADCDADAGAGVGAGRTAAPNLPAALVALRCSGRGWLLEVWRDGSVTEPSPASCRVVDAALRDRRVRSRGGTEASTTGGIDRARTLAERHLRSILATRAAPAPIAASAPPVVLARRLRAALRRAGPAPPASMVRRVDEALERLSRPLPPRLVSQARWMVEEHAPSEPLHDVLDRLERALFTQPLLVGAGGGRLPGEGADRIETVAVLEVGRGEPEAVDHAPRRD